MVMRSGSTPECSIANILPGAPEAGLDLVDDQQDAVLVADLAQSAQELEGRDVEAALALDRLDDDRGDARRLDVRLEQELEREAANPRP